MKPISLFALAFVTISQLHAQDIYHFDKALALGPASHYGREALYTDALLYNMYTGNLRKPVEGDSLLASAGKYLKWTAVTADTAHLFRNGRGFSGGGYFYLTYQSEKEQTVLLNSKGSGAVVVNGEMHAGDPYSMGWLYIPLSLKKGMNEFYVRGNNVRVDLIFPAKPIILNAEDATLPFIVRGDANNDLMGAIVLLNATQRKLEGLKIKSLIAGKEVTTEAPAILPLSSRKIIFHFDASGADNTGDERCRLELMGKSGLVDSATVTLKVVDPTDKYATTFLSDIDGSLQYYAVTPQLGAPKSGGALFLSVHGAGVEAIGQARAYQSKDWGTLVAATNRRPRGFNWEDWGRLDALEVLSHAKEKFKPDPQKIYLTGHSMGGHGTWFLGATYPDKWAAIGACSGYASLKEYGSADGIIPDSSNSPIEQMLLRSGNQSDVLRLVSNYKAFGVYILHGDSDRVVPVRFARQMRKVLSEFHSDWNYYEYPNGEHWFGDQSVDWKPLFDFFKWHHLPTDTGINQIDFITSNPGISSSFHWATVVQQEHPLQYSQIQLRRNRSTKSITGNTKNVRLLRLTLSDFHAGDSIRITLDTNTAIAYHVRTQSDSLFLLKQNSTWTITGPPGFHQKGPHRNGTLKDAFNHHMVFVYSTNGSKEENAWSLQKARYDAETWYYRGNGAVDIIADKDFSPDRYHERGVILFGNKTTNSAWQKILNDCPIQLERGRISAGSKTWEGNDLAACFVWPLANSSIASIAVIGGTGIAGMRAANANQYFAGASGFPDFMIYRLAMISTGTGEIRLAGFFDNNWKLSETEFVQNN